MADAEKLRILLIGNGSREHALAWKLSQSARVERIHVVPGNGGTANGLPGVSNVSEVKADDYPGLVAFSDRNGTNLVVPGPEAPLVDGIEGFFRKGSELAPGAGIPCFGPTKAAARMEGSKTFSKDFMNRHHIPTAEYRNFNNYDAAKDYLDTVPHGVVIKASGLAAGKGVIIPTTKREAHDALREIMLEKQFGAAGDEIVIEEYLDGDELSILTLSDGVHIQSMYPAQDHKRVHDGDQGPNTGGMGCYAPSEIVSKTKIKDIDRDIIQRTIDGMREEAMPFIGCLFTGLMLCKDGKVKVLEYNIRFGDPECQTLMPLISADTDLARVMLACTHQALDKAIQVNFILTSISLSDADEWDHAAEYPKNITITLDPTGKDTTLFHAGTKVDGGQLKTSGGRVISSTATADTLEEAVKNAYEGVHCIHFDKMHYRKDIANRAFRHAVGKGREAMTYASAGVSINAGNSLVKQIKDTVRSTRRAGADSELGGFGGTFDLASAGYSTVPVLIGAIDGVGTKLKVAQAVGKQDTVGIDLVAMNVNDLVVQGAEPLFFLDCYSCSRLDVNSASAFVSGVAEGCRQAKCALIGGETAEMPGLYSGDEYDAVGAAVGAVHRDRILPKAEEMVAGDVLLGVASNGVHSNGFSLVRKIIERANLSYDSPAPWEDIHNDASTSTSNSTPQTVGLSLLTPTRIYVRSVLPAVSRGLIKGMSHITGGGLVENVPRMLPPPLSPHSLVADIDVSTWPLPPVFEWLKRAGHIESAEFARAFNTGLGMVLVVAAEHVPTAIDLLRQGGETVFEIGSLRLSHDDEVDGGERCVLRNLDAWDI
ncbi:MAG: hypothetical protein M1837_005718 [Sclerophora amabilis]|nr:MAG: hypothetical protein M1837_005718 [Sclerophora amabilis]